MWRLPSVIPRTSAPREQTPLTTSRFVEFAQDVRPPGVAQVVTGDGVPVGDRPLGQPSIRLVSLTGDWATGKLIAKSAPGDTALAELMLTDAELRFKRHVVSVGPVVEQLASDGLAEPLDNGEFLSRTRGMFAPAHGRALPGGSPVGSASSPPGGGR